MHFMPALYKQKQMQVQRGQATRVILCYVE